MSTQATRIRIALAGNPNCGKTTLFNALTGARQRVGNWPGVTVERKSGTRRHGDSIYEIVDLPGTYALVAPGHRALDETIAVSHLLNERPDLIINVVDASTLERGLLLTLELLELGIPVVVALNMIDVAHRVGVHVDPNRLANALGVPVVPLVASRGEGIESLLDVVELRRADAPAAALGLQRAQSQDLEAVIAHATSAFKDRNSARLLAIGQLSGDSTLAVAGSQQPDERVARDFARSLVADRYQRVDGIVEVAAKRSVASSRISEVIDAVVLHPVAAIPIFLLVMYLMFMLSINLGSAFIDFFDILGAAFFVELPRLGLAAVHAPAWLIAFLADGLGGGVQLVATFIPVIGALFLCLSFLEDSGYMARAAFVVDRAMRAVGLPGKAFVPLIVGFGCNIPAVMATRSLERAQDRLLTSLMSPFMSCGARLTVYALFAAAFFPRNGQNVVFALYLLGIAVAVITAFALRKYVLRDEGSSFMMELPPYHLPNGRGLLLHTWHRLHGFVMRAGKAIIAVVVVLNLANSLGTDGTFGNQNTEKSALSAIGQSITPVFEPMGLTDENWPATVGIFTGIFAKEVVVGTLDALYGAVAGNETADAEAFSLGGAVMAAFASVGANLLALGDSVLDPLGLSIENYADASEAARAQGVALSTVGLMRELFDGTAGAFAYLVLILLYMPCVATIGAIVKEQGVFWAGFSALWSFATAYSLAVICYQVGIITRDPMSSLAWVSSMLLLMFGSAALLIRWARSKVERPGLIPVVQLK